MVGLLNNNNNNNKNLKTKARVQEQETEGNWPRIKSWSKLSSWMKSMFQIQKLLTEEVDGPLKERTHFKRKVLGLWHKNYHSEEGHRETSEAAPSFLAKIVNEKSYILEG